MRQPFDKPHFLKRKIILIPLILLLSYFLILVPASRLMTHLIGKMALIEFFITLTPKSYLDGVNILAFGIDNTRGIQRSDTIMVFHLDEKEKRMGVLSIPRDTRMNVPGHGLSKVNHAYAYGGVDLLRQTVAEFLNIPIHYYFKVDLAGVESLIDQVGGVHMTVDKDLYYVDKAGDLYIDIKQGVQHLDGKQAMQYLRFRQDAQGDLGRIQRQQSFLQAFARKIKSSGKLTELPRIVSKINRSIDSNLNKKEMLGLALQFTDIFEAGQLQKGTVPGGISLVDGISYWKPNMTVLDQEVHRILLGSLPEIDTVSLIETEDKEASEESRRPVTMKELNRVVDQSDVQEDALALTDVSIEILNGMGVPGVAKKFASVLKLHDLKVSRFDNAGSFDYAETLLVDWKGNVDTAILLSQLMSIDPSRIIVYDKPQKSIDFTIVLGQDWATVHNQLQGKL